MALKILVKWLTCLSSERERERELYVQNLSGVLWSAIPVVFFSDVSYLKFQHESKVFTAMTEENVDSQGQKISN